MLTTVHGRKPTIANGSKNENRSVGKKRKDSRIGTAAVTSATALLEMKRSAQLEGRSSLQATRASPTPSSTTITRAP
jgi:hypothetical protein